MVFGGSVLAVLVTAAAAWACTATASLSANPGEAPAGSRVMVTGGQLGAGPVEVRWNSATGPVLTTVQGPDFTVAVTIPTSANIDTHLIYAKSSSNSARVVFQVVAGSPNQPTNTARSGAQGTNAGSSISGAGDPGSETSGSTATQGTEAVSSESGAGFPAANGSPADPQPSSTRETSGTSSNQTAVAPAAQAAPTATPAPAGRPAGAQAAAAPGDEPTRATPGSSTEAAAATGPSPASAMGDPWSGFEPGQPLERGASLIDPASDSSSGPLQAGVLAFSGALVALFAGFGVAELRRARVKAH